MKRLFRLGFISALAVPVMTLAFVSGPASAAPAAPPPTTPPPTACSAGVAAPTNTFPGTTVTANNFESGTLAGFTVNTGTTGTASIDKTQAHSGTCSAHLHVTSDPGSLANLVTSLPANSNDVYADAWFNITTAGVAGNDVPYFRFFFDTTRFVDIYRYNSNGQMWLRVTIPSTGTTPAFNYTKLVSGTIALNAWRHVSMHVIANGAASTVEVWLDGTSIYSSNAVDTTATTVTAVQLGAEHLTQMGDEYIDDLVIKTGTGTAATTTWPLFKTSYDGTIYELVTNTNGTQTPAPLTFAKWRDVYAFKAPNTAPTDFVRYSWSPTLYAVTFWPGGSASWQWTRLTFQQWQAAGYPSARNAGWIKGTSYYKWATSSELFASGEDGVLHKLTPGEWAAAGQQAYSTRTDQGLMKLTWAPSIAQMTSISTGKGSPLSYSQWRTEGFPTPQSVQRFKGDQFYQNAGSSTIWYAGPTMNRPITYKEWTAAGQPAPTHR